MSTVKALMVDIDGVLILKRQSWHRFLEADLGISPCVLTAYFFRPLWSRIVVGEIPLKQALSGILERLYPEVTADTLIEYWFSRDAERNEAALQETIELRSQGFIVHGASNQEHMRAMYLWQTVGLRNHLDHLHYSADIKHKKPDERFFDTVIRKSNLRPENVCLIDDSLENVDGARKAGWQSVHWTHGMSLKAAIDSNI